MARLTQKSLDDAFARGGSSTDAYENVKKRQQTTQENQAERDAKIAQLVKGDELKQQGMARQITEAERLRSQYGPEANVNVEGVSIGGVDPLMSLLRRRELSQPKLTPAQEMAEKTAAKKISDYDATGGKAVSQQQLDAVRGVKSDVTGKKRDWWDRAVGGATSGMPSLMGMVAPAEKGRRDRVYAAAATRLKQLGDPNPTEARIKETMGQIYDPASDDATNLERLEAFERQISENDAEMARSSQNLQRTGYIMPGLAGNPAGSPGGPPAPRQQSGQRPPSFEEWKRMKAGK